MNNYGDEVWKRILARAGISEIDVWSLSRKPFLCRRLLIVAARELGVARHEVLEDLGAWLARQDPVPRMTRFIGITYNDFIRKIPDLPGQLGVVFDDILGVEICVREISVEKYIISFRYLRKGWMKVIEGALRAVADNYGALIVVSCRQECLDLDIFCDA